MTEVFKKITVPFFSNVYEISDCGNVRRDGHILKRQTNKYRRNEQSVRLSYMGKVKMFKVHHLVVWAFPEICGQWFDGAEVDHIDCNPENNIATNLRVTDRKGNMANPSTRKKLEAVWESEGFKTAQSERMKGDNNPARRCMTEEWRNNMSLSRRGRKHTEEAKIKMSAAARGRYKGKNSPCSKKVGYINADGVLVIFYGYREAERETGINRKRIAESAKNGTKCKEGIVWQLC